MDIYLHVLMSIWGERDSFFPENMNAFSISTWKIPKFENILVTFYKFEVFCATMINYVLQIIILMPSSSVF